VQVEEPYELRRHPEAVRSTRFSDISVGRWMRSKPGG